jgi:serine/threonine protein kinase
MEHTTQSPALPDSSPAFAAPDIPGLQILEKIGQGGMASVYLAMQTSLQRPVAVKILNNPETPGFHERFMNEGRYIAALSHSNIVDVHDVGECDGLYYIVMEYLPDGDLKRRIRKGIEPDKALEHAVQLAGCLDYLHGQGIVHRDLKPSNILFRGDGNPVITDFGIAKILQQENELTRSGELMGSPYYLSPEQAVSSTHIDGRSDLYSLGIIIFEMLTGRHPFTGDNFVAIVMAHREKPIPLLPERLIQYQPLIDQLLPKHPDERFQSGAELIEEIHGLYTEDAVEWPEAYDRGESATGMADEVSIRRNSELLHFESGVGWLSRLIFAVIVLSAVGFILIQQQNPLMIDLQAQVRQWLTHWDEKPSVVGPLEKVALEAPQQWASAEVERLAEIADRRLREFKMSFPEGDSALHYFREILKLQPDNQTAKTGIAQILDWYIQQAETAVDLGDYQLAGRYVGRGNSIDGQHPTLLALSRELALNGAGEKP